MLFYYYIDDSSIHALQLFKTGNYIGYIYSSEERFLFA